MRTEELFVCRAVPEGDSVARAKLRLTNGKPVGLTTKLELESFAARLWSAHREAAFYLWDVNTQSCLWSHAEADVEACGVPVFAPGTGLCYRVCCFEDTSYGYDSRVGGGNQSRFELPSPGLELDAFSADDTLLMGFGAFGDVHALDLRMRKWHVPWELIKLLPTTPQSQSPESKSQSALHFHSTAEGLHTDADPQTGRRPYLHCVWDPRALEYCGVLVNTEAYPGVMPTVGKLHFR